MIAKNELNECNNINYIHFIILWTVKYILRMNLLMTNTMDYNELNRMNYNGL